MVHLDLPVELQIPAQPCIPASWQQLIAVAVVWCSSEMEHQERSDQRPERLSRCVRSVAITAGQEPSATGFAGKPRWNLVVVGNRQRHWLPLRDPTGCGPDQILQASCVAEGQDVERALGCHCRGNGERQTQ